MGSGPIAAVAPSATADLAGGSTGGTIAAVAPSATADLAGGSTGGTIAASGPSPTASATAGVPVSGTAAAVAPGPTTVLVGVGSANTGSVTAVAPMPRAAGLGSSAITQADLSPGEPGYVEGAAPTDLVGPVGWQVRAVTAVGQVVNLLGGVTVERVHRSLNGDRRAELTIPAMHVDAGHFDLFSHEVQLWLDGAVHFWGRPAQMDLQRQGQTDEVRAEIDDLFGYLHDVVVGGEKVNHIVSPHEDASTVGNTPTSWAIRGGVDQSAIVDNNWEFWHARKAIQVNNHGAGEDAYITQSFVVPPELDGVPFAAAATCYISDNEAGSPAWGGPAYNERGLMIHRIDGSTFVPVNSPKVAKITEDTPRNALVRLQTDEVVALAGEIIEVRLYAPSAWVAWRWAGLFDGRAVSVDRTDKAAAIRVLAEHGQDVTIGKQDHRIGTDIVTVGETVSREWPWWRRDVVGEQIEDLADDIEFTVDITATTRTLKVRRRIGVKHATTLTKADFVGWGMGIELGPMASRQIRQGDGQGIARDEWWESNPSALRGNVRENLEFAGPGETLAQLRDNARADLTRSARVTKLPRARITGQLAKQIREGDTVPVNIDHGWGQFLGDARAMAIDFDGLAATLSLEPVS